MTKPLYRSTTRLALATRLCVCGLVVLASLAAPAAAWAQDEPAAAPEARLNATRDYLRGVSKLGSRLAAMTSPALTSTASTGLLSYQLSPQWNLQAHLLRQPGAVSTHFEANYRFSEQLETSVGVANLFSRRTGEADFAYGLGSAADSALPARMQLRPESARTLRIGVRLGF